MHVFHQSIRLFFSFFQTQTSPRRIYEEKPKPDNKIDKIDKIPPVTKKDQSVSVNNDFPIIPKPLTCDTFSQTIKRLPSIGPTDLVNIVDIPSHVVEQKLSSLGDDIDKTINLDTDENIIETENEILDIIFSNFKDFVLVKNLLWSNSLTFVGAVIMISFRNLETLYFLGPEYINNQFRLNLNPIYKCSQIVVAVLISIYFIL